jgi:hypothetical protein
MAEKFPLGSAKTAKDLKSAYDDAKKEAAKHGFPTATALKEAVIAQAMTDAKKPAEFVIEAAIKGNMIVLDFYCEVKGSVKSVLGRKDLKDAKGWKDAVALAKNANLSKVAKANNW